MKIGKFVLVGAFGMLFLVAFLYLREHGMTRISFDLGRNIRETAKASGAPRWGTSDVAGYMSFEVVDLPPDIPAVYQRPGYEIAAGPLFALSLYADKDNDMAVEAATLQFSANAATEHDSARLLVEELISQFQKGKWQRHIDELCPAVTGRSSYLNEAGELERIGFCPLDPAHRISSTDWVTLMAMTQHYQWKGEGVLATLTVSFSDDIRGLTYSVNLEFEDMSIKRRRDEEARAHALAEGGAAELKRLEEEKKNDAARKVRVETLEENARRRGDMVIER